jgi:hypothetical protein
MREKFKALCDYFELAQTDMKPHLAAWEEQRNPLSHGRFRTRDIDFRHQGLIAGAVNIFSLKSMAFSRKALVDTFGENPRRSDMGRAWGGITNILGQKLIIPASSNGIWQA